MELCLGLCGLLEEIQLLLHGSEHQLQELRIRTKSSFLELLDHVLPGFHRIIHTGHVIRPRARFFVVLSADLSALSAEPAVSWDSSPRMQPRLTPFHGTVAS